MKNSTTAVTETGLNALDTARLQYNRVALMERQTKNSVKPPIGTTDVAGLGLNALDTICIVPRLPEPNGKLRIRDLRVEPGGQVATALVTCTRLGLTDRYIGCVGKQETGNERLASLTAWGLTVEVLY